ncbi:hypothetical protein IV102_25595 [bacterium]|nr:hypothetical protein [bacterium]
MRWRFLVHSRLNEDSKKLHQLGLALGSGRVFVEATWDQEKRLDAKSFHEVKNKEQYFLVSHEGARLGPYGTREESHAALRKLEHRPVVHHHQYKLGPKEKVLVTGSQWQSEFNHLLVEATSTLIKEEEFNATLPRWRVHHVDSLEKLVKKFKHLALIPNNGVGNQLQEIKFGDKAWANQIQGGMSDWDWVRSLLWHYQGFTRDLAMKPLILSGSVSESQETNGRWIFTWGRQETYKALGEVSSRRLDWGKAEPAHDHPPKYPDTQDSHRSDDNEIDDEIYQGHDRALFGGKAPKARSYHLPGVPIPQSGQVRHRRAFSEQAWKDWRTRDVPLFTEKEQVMCWRVVDKLYDTTSPDVLGWNTKVEFLPPKAIAPQEQPMLPLSRWTSRGKVLKQYRKGPWIELEMPACFSKQNKKENIVYARLMTAHAGKDGTAGLHFIPEQGTRVGITWSGQFDESILCLGNIRMKETEYPHPSCWIESDSIGRFKDVRVKSIGKTDIDSDWRVGVKKQASLDSLKMFTVAGEGVRSDYKSGVKNVVKGKSSAPWRSDGTFSEMLGNLPDLLKELKIGLKDLKRLMKDAPEKLKELMAKLDQLKQALKDFKKLWNENQQAAKEVLQALKQIPDTLKEMSRNLQKIPDSLDSLHQTLQSIPDSIKVLAQSVKGLPDEAAKAISETVQVLTQGVPEIVRESTQALKNLPPQILKEALEALPDNVKTIPQTIQALPELVGNLPPNIAREFVQQLPPSLQSLPADAASVLKASTEMGASLKPELMKQLPASVQKLPRELGKSAAGVMKELPDFSRQMSDIAGRMPVALPAAGGLALTEPPASLTQQTSQLLEQQSEGLVSKLPVDPQAMVETAKKEIPTLGNLRRPRGLPPGL